MYKRGHGTGPAPRRKPAESRKDRKIGMAYIKAKNVMLYSNASIDEAVASVDEKIRAEVRVRLENAA